MANLYEILKTLQAAWSKRDHHVQGIGRKPWVFDRFENGRKQTLKYETLDKIASYFGTSVDTLVSGEQKKTRPSSRKAKLTRILNGLSRS